jgi:ArsR family transcriptional regulator
MNMNAENLEEQLADFLKVMGSPIRIQILFSIGDGQACVCHLEAVLKKRQAYISQHLMVLRDAGILKTRREGKFIYYRLSDPSILEWLETTSELLEPSQSVLAEYLTVSDPIDCQCPLCLKKGQEGNTP